MTDTMTVTIKVVDEINDGGRPWKTLPRCSAEVDDFTKRWRERAGKDDICEMNARYLVDGKPLCRRHAGNAVLKLVTAGRRPVHYSRDV